MTYDSKNSDVFDKQIDLLNSNATVLFLFQKYLVTPKIFEPVSVPTNQIWTHKTRIKYNLYNLYRSETSNRTKCLLAGRGAPCYFPSTPTDRSTDTGGYVFRGRGLRRGEPHAPQDLLRAPSFRYPYVCVLVCGYENVTTACFCALLECNMQCVLLVIYYKVFVVLPCCWFNMLFLFCCWWRKGKALVIRW